jgi:hypothetical protein
LEVVVRRLRGSIIFVLCVATSACGSSAKNSAGTGGSGAGGGSGGGAGTNVDGAVGAISCDPFTACGGNIVGAWQLVSNCGSISTTPCASSERISSKSSWAHATYTFAGDGTFTATATNPLTESLRYPLGCLGAITDAGIPQACADLERLFLAPPQPSDGGTQPPEVQSASCSAVANETCACTAVLSYMGAPTTSGSYTTSGNQITFGAPGSDGGAPDAGATAVWEYCVSGNNLALHVTSSTYDWIWTMTR